MSRRRERFVALVLSIGALGLFDWWSGPEVSFSVLYLLPVSAGAHSLGRRAGLWLSVLAALTWLSGDLAWGWHVRPLAHAWNLLSLSATLVAATLLITSLDSRSSELHSANGRLSQLLAREEQLSRTDLLTGLWNGRAFRELLSVEIERARRTGALLSVAYLDLDNFKQLNDRLGHAAGDELLRKVAQAIQRSVRAADVAARLGGDEFAVYLHGAAESGHDAVLERLLAAVRAAGSDAGAGVTASVGCARVRGPKDSDELVRLADAAMYEAKAAGKNRVMTRSR